MNLSSIDLVVSEKTMFLYIDGTPICVTFATRRAKFAKKNA